MLLGIFRGALTILLLMAFSAQAEMGFHSFEEEIPAALQAVPENVFQLVAPGGDKRTVDITDWSEKEILEHAEAASRNRWRPDLRTASIQQQLQTCAVHNISTCSYRDGLVTSSSFLLQSPRIVIATYHGVDEHIEVLESMGLNDEQILETPLPWALMNPQGEVIRWTSSAKLLLPEGRFEGDMIVLDAAELHSEGLPFDSEKVVDNDSILYAAGYPSESKGREKFGAKNSVLDQLSYTTGQLTNATRLSRSVMMDYVYFHDYREPMTNTYFVTDLDGIGGMSGGPLLTDDGFVIGYLTSTVTPKGNKPLTTLFVNLVQLLSDPSFMN